MTIRLLLLAALFLLPYAATAVSAPPGKAQKYMGNDIVFTGEGDTLGNGETVSVYGPVSVGFNTINKDVYVSAYLGHSIRKVVWKQSTTTTLIGSTAGWAPGGIDSLDPHVARLNTPWGRLAPSKALFSSPIV